MKIKSKIWIETEEGIIISDGRIQLLKLIEETGSLNKAAKAMNISYQKAWKLVDASNKASKEPLVETQIGGNKGGGTVLTPYGKSLIKSFEAINAECWEFLDAELEKTRTMTVSDLLGMPLLLVLLPIVAFLYASVGHGGASGYLALMSAFSFPMTYMKPTALVLNILVSSVSFYFYYRENNFKWNLFYPFALTSIPFSFVGGYLKTDAFYYKIILATVLVFAVLRLLGFFGKEKNTGNKINLPLALGFGSLIGFLSGLLGIGGGIILSPVLLLFGWATMKQAAAVSALFILTNSIAGLCGFVSQGGMLPESSLVLISVVFIGGLFGAYFGSLKFNSKSLRYVLSAVIGIAIVKLYTTA